MAETLEERSWEDEDRDCRRKRRHSCLRGVEIGSMRRRKQSQDRMEKLQHIYKVTGM